MSLVSLGALSYILEAIVKNIKAKLRSRKLITEYTSHEVRGLPANGIPKEITSDQIVPTTNKISVITARINVVGLRGVVLSFENGNTKNAKETAVNMENVANNLLSAS